MMIPVRFYIFAALFCCCFALECYTGFKYIKGQSIGTSKETCESSSDYCFNASADLTMINKIKWAGCSTYRCLLAHNKCLQTKFDGHDVRLCCCNTEDLCNSMFTPRLYVPLLLLATLWSL